MACNGILKTRILPIFFVCVMISAMLCSCSGSKPLKLIPGKVKEGVIFEGEDIGGLSEGEVLKRIEAIAGKKNREAADAAVNPLNWDIIPEVKGYRVNVLKTLEAILNAEEGEEVSTIGEEFNPSLTEAQLRQVIVTIGEYITPLLDKQGGRVNNIEIAIEKINTKIVNPGETFSFNGTVGLRTEDKGYEKAPIIVKGHKEMATGGGICQISSTLFNAVDKAGLTVTERHSHSKKVGYVPYGRDAAINYGTQDLKFQNNRSNPVMIRAERTDKDIHVWIIENTQI